MTGITILFCLQGIPTLYYGTEQALHGHGNSDRFVREALWGKPGGFDTSHRFYKAIQQLSGIRASQPALRYGRLYFRPISGNGTDFGPSNTAPGVLAFSRILNQTEVIVVANLDAGANFQGHVIADRFLHKANDAFRVINDPAAPQPGNLVTRSNLVIHEIDGRITSGPANTIAVNVAPMSVQIITR